MITSNRRLAKQNEDQPYSSNKTPEALHLILSFRARPYVWQVRNSRVAISLVLACISTLCGDTWPLAVNTLIINRHGIVDFGKGMASWDVGSGYGVLSSADGMAASREVQEVSRKIDCGWKLGGQSSGVWTAKHKWERRFSYRKCVKFWALQLESLRHWKSYNYLPRWRLSSCLPLTWSWCCRTQNASQYWRAGAPAGFARRRVRSAQAMHVSLWSLSSNGAVEAFGEAVCLSLNATKPPKRWPCYIMTGVATVVSLWKLLFLRDGIRSHSLLRVRGLWWIRFLHLALPAMFFSPWITVAI